MPTSVEPGRRIGLATALTISQAIASETTVERLGARLAALAIGHAGATRARFVSAAEADNALPATIVAQFKQTRQPILGVADDLTPAMWLPVFHDNLLLGVLCIEGVKPPVDDHAAIAELIAGIASVALAHAQRDVERDDLEEAQRLSRTAVIERPDHVEYMDAIINTAAAKHAAESARLAEQAQALQATKERLELALRGSDVGVWDFDLSSGDIATAPVYSVNMWDPLGYGSELPISRWHPDRWHPDDGPLLRAAIDAHLSGKTPEFELELRFRDVDGNYTWHLTRGRAQRRPDGTPHRFTGIAIDLTEKKVLEQQLRHAKDAAETSNRAKDMFVANVSHEIRNPMNVILGMTELALSSELTDDQRVSMSTVRSAAENLLVIIDDLLDFAKMEADKIELTSAPFGLRATLDDAMQASSLRARQKQLELISEVGDDVGDAVVGDMARLRQISAQPRGQCCEVHGHGRGPRQRPTC